MASAEALAAWTALQGYLVASGKIDGHSDVFKFGFNAAVGIAEETIWEQGGRYAHPTSASTMTVSSDSADDTAAGTGARTVQVYGLDGNYDEIDETVTLAGQTPVSTVNSFLRVNRGIVRSAGAGGENAGVIYVGTGTVTAGVPANIFTTVAAGENQTLQAFYTVPARRTAYLFMVLSSSFGNANSVATVRLRARPEGEVFQTKDKFLLTRGVVPLPHMFPVPFEAKTDLELTGMADTGTLDVSGSLELMLIGY